MADVLSVFCVKLNSPVPIELACIAFAVIELAAILSALMFPILLPKV